jgi:hypothetical protein
MRRFSTAPVADQPIGQGALAMIDVRDDAEIADAGLRHGGNIVRSEREKWGVGVGRVIW